MDTDRWVRPVSKRHSIEKAFKTLRDSIMVTARLPFTWLTAIFLRSALSLPNRRIDDAYVVGQHAVYNRPVATPDRVICKLHDKRLMGDIIYRR